MDFLDPSKKRKHQIKLIIGYALIAIAIALVTMILVFQSYGYDLDRKTGLIIQNGLLVVTAQPVPADIYLNGKQYKSQSDARLVLPSDIYKLELKNSGYRTWSRTISLAGGTIERFIYPFLFPTAMTAKTQKTYAAAPPLTTQSPDRHWLLVEHPDQIGTFDQFDANDNKKAATTVTIPAGVLTASPQNNLVVTEWSNDNRHFLLQHDYGGGREFVMVDRETPASSYNVNKTFSNNPDEVFMHDKKYDQLYLFNKTARTLATADVKTADVKTLLINVLAFKSHGANLILYATDELATAGKTRIMVHDETGSYLLREVTASPTYFLDLAQFNNHWHVAAGGMADNRVYVFKDPFNSIKSTDPTSQTLPETALRVTNPSWLEFSANTQFITLEGGSQFATYDFENSHSYKYDIKLSLDAAAPHATWMDGNRLILNSQGKMVVFDYDGTNLQTLLDNQPGLIPTFDRQYKLLYTLSPTGSNGSFGLQRTNLIVGQNN